MCFERLDFIGGLSNCNKMLNILYLYKLVLIFGVLVRYL